MEGAEPHPAGAPSNVRAPIPPATTVLAAGAARLCFDPDLVYDRAFGALLGAAIGGALLGAAIGDALGLQVEGEDAGAVAGRHPQGVDLPYGGSYKGYIANDWTDATDSAVLVMRSLAAYFGGKTDEPAHDFAARLRHWQKGGFPELGDTAGLTPEGVTIRALAQPGFAADPAEAAREVKGPKAENGALVRTIACAFTAAPEAWATLYCETTHADDRCLASAVMLTLLLNALSRVPGDAPIAASIALGPIAAGRDLIADPARKADYMRRLTDSKNLAALALGERDNRSYVLKTLSCAMWALRQLTRTPPRERNAAFFAATLRRVAAEGGDASANCQVVGAVLGAALGHNCLPQEWLNAPPHHKWLLLEIKTFLEAVAPTWEIPSDQ